MDHFLSLYWVCYKCCFCFSFWFLVLRHVGSYHPDQGSNLHPLHWKLKSYTTGPPGKFLNMNSVSLNSYAGTKIPIQVEDGNFKHNTKFEDHHPITSPSTNQKKSLHTREDNENSDLFPKWLTVINFSFLPLEFSWSSRIFGVGSCIWVCLLSRLLVSRIKQTPN